ncbi:MAG: SDR family NAD(P)-dependent oxidoreductase [Planctomycetes bacterium]|nr:SDR family NAD(P)-dependent oxidoreductase [Planctomycetota bacterium]
MEGALKGKIALISGAGRGIGKQISIALANEGIKVAICSRTAQERDSTARLINSKHGNERAKSFFIDLMNPESVEKCVREVTSTFGKIDILINNAATFASKPVSELTLEEWNSVINTNLTGTFILTKQVLPQMIERRDGDIVFISSTSGKRGTANTSAYAASKFGLNGFAHVLIYEVRKFNIRVTTMSPSAVDTEERGDTRAYRVQATDIAECIVNSLKLNKRVQVRDIEIWATNPNPEDPRYLKIPD